MAAVCNPYCGWLYRSRTSGVEGNGTNGRERRVYCVLIGTILLEYNSEDEARLGASAAKAMMEIVGVSASGGDINSPTTNSTTNRRFIYVTAAGTICQATSVDSEEKYKWVAAMKLGLSTTLEAHSTSGSPGSLDLIPLPSLSDSAYCVESGQYFNMTHPRNHCLSCGGAYVSELSSRESPLLHHGRELCVRVCDRCRSCQEMLAVLKSHNALLLMYSKEVSHVETALREVTEGRTDNMLDTLGAPKAQKFLQGKKNSIGKKQRSKSTGSFNESSQFDSIKTRDEFIIRHCKRWYNTTEEGSVFDTSILSTKEFMELIAVKQLAFSDKVDALASAYDAAALIRMLYDNILSKQTKTNSGEAAVATSAVSSDTCSDLSSFRLVLEALTSIAKGQKSEKVGRKSEDKGDIATTSTASSSSGRDVEDLSVESPSELRGEYKFEDSSVDFNIPQLLHLFFLLLPAKLSAVSLETPSTPLDTDIGGADDGDQAGETQVSESNHQAELESTCQRKVEEAVASSSHSLSRKVVVSGGCSLCEAVEELIKLELLRDFLLSLCESSLTVAMRVVWSLLGYLEDAHLALDKGVTPQTERLDSKKAWISLFALDVEATVASKGRPLGSCFGDSRGLFPKLFRPTPGQLSALMTETAVLERYRECLKLPARTWLPNTTLTVEREHSPVPTSGIKANQNQVTSPPLEKSSPLVGPCLTTDIDAMDEEACGDGPNGEASKETDVCEEGTSAPPSPTTSPASQSTSAPMASPQKWRKRANPSLANHLPAAPLDTIPRLVTSSSDETSGWCDFYKQLAFTSTLTDIAEKMRFIDPKDRMEELKKELTQLNEAHWRLGFFPIQSAEHPPFPVIRMPASEGYVFKTKARAPTLVLFEILRPEEDQLAEIANKNSQIENTDIEPLDFSNADCEESDNDNDGDSKDSPLSAAASMLDKPPLHNDSPNLSACRSGSLSNSSFKLDNDEIDSSSVDMSEVNESVRSELVEVESLIGDQIERRLTRSASLDETSLEPGTIKASPSRSYDFENEDMTIQESQSSSKVDTSQASLSQLALRSESRQWSGGSDKSSRNKNLPARNEVRMMVREHSRLLPSSQLDRNLVEDEFHSHGVTSPDYTQEEDDDQEGDGTRGSQHSQELSDLDIAAAAAAAAVATSLSRSSSGLDQASIGAQAAALAAAATVARAPSSSQSSDGKAVLSTSRSSENLTIKKKSTARPTSAAVKRARDLYASGAISAAELEQFIEADKQFQEHYEESLALDEKFLVSIAFGESWIERKARIKSESPEGHRKGWDLVGLIIKSNDDLRQEVCALQLIELSRRLFDSAGLPLFLRSYRIISTDASTGVIELLTDAISLDALKKRQLQSHNPNNSSDPSQVAGLIGLPAHFDATYGTDTTRARDARWRFASSLAAYSAVCHAFAIKDRHNGNILLDTEGHLIHIDFGFILGIAPGGAFSIETAPFKLTDEMVQVLGDVQSKLFAEFVLLFSCAFLALQAGYAEISGLIEVMCEQSTFPCFENVTKADVLSRLHARLRPDLNKRESVGFAIDLIRQSMGSTLTRQYDNFQYLTNGIIP